MYYPTANSYFSGFGLMDHGLSQAGIQIKQSLELDPVACRVLRLNFSHKIIEQDISQTTCLDQFRADFHVLTFPCKFYSMHSATNGSKTTRVRGDHLFLHAFRHVVLLQPEGFILENVPRMKAHAVVSECFEKIPGYYVQTFCPVNASTWLPQDRKRLILIATKKRFPISPPNNFRQIPLSEIVEPRPDLEVPNYVTYRMQGRYRDKPVVCDPTGKEGRMIAPTLLASYGQNLGTRIVIDKSHPLGYRQFSIRECARLMGIPDSFKLEGSSRAQYRGIGNGVAVPLATWAGREIVRYFNR